MTKLLLIDGNSIINRAYFALPPLNDKEGRNVNAVYGFVNILFKVVQDFAPDKLVVAFDKRGTISARIFIPSTRPTARECPTTLQIRCLFCTNFCRLCR